MRKRKSIYGKFEILINEKLNSLGFKSFLINAHPSPDIIAFKDKKIYLIEVKYGNVINIDQLSFLKKLCKEFREIGVNCIVVLAKKVNDCSVKLINYDDYSIILDLDICIDDF